MPLYIADYLADTMHLTTEQHGAYMLLIMAAWKSGGRVRNDDSELSAITRMQPARWATNRKTLVSFFQTDGDWLTHKRVFEELARASVNSAKRSKAGSKGAATRWQTHGKAIANASQNDGPSPSPNFTTFVNGIPLAKEPVFQGGSDA